MKGLVCRTGRLVLLGWMCVAFLAPVRADETDDAVGQLGDLDASVRVAAMEKLGAMGEEAVPALARGLDSPESLVRFHSLRLLSGMKRPELAERYASFLTSNDYLFVRREAAIALGKCGSEAALEPLIRYTKRDPVAGAEALGFHGDPVVLPELITLMIQVSDDLAAFIETRPQQPDVVRSQEGPRAGALAVIAGAVTRLGSRGGITTLLDTLKYTEWVGMYSRSIFKEYLGEDMPPILPPRRRDENRDVLAVVDGLVKFWDMKALDTYVHELEKKPVEGPLADKCRALIQKVGELEGEELRKQRNLIVLLGKPVLPLLFEAIGDKSGPMYLNEELLRIVYEMGASVRYARSRNPRLTRRVYPDVAAAVEASEDSAFRAELLGVIGELAHWQTYSREVENFSHLYTIDVYAEIEFLRSEAKDFLLGRLDPGADPADQVAALNALCKIGEEDIVDPIVNLLACVSPGSGRSSGCDSRPAARRCRRATTSSRRIPIRCVCRPRARWQWLEIRRAYRPFSKRSNGRVRPSGRLRRMPCGRSPIGTWDSWRTVMPRAVRRPWIAGRRGTTRTRNRSRTSCGRT